MHYDTHEKNTHIHVRIGDCHEDKSRKTYIDVDELTSFLAYKFFNLRILLIASLTPFLQPNNRSVDHFDDHTF